MDSTPSRQHTAPTIAYIADFYSQISQDKAQAGLEAAGITPNRADSVERFLSNWSKRSHARGIPTGPFASIPLAELGLHDVDQFLL